MLASYPHLGNRRVLKTLSRSEGLTTLYYIPSQERPLSLADPFLLAEWVVSDRGGEARRVESAKLIDPLTPLRASYAALQAAGQIASDLLATQQPGKAADVPFALALWFFRALGKLGEPALGACAFRVKLLLYEGVLSVETPPSSLSPDEQQTLQRLGEARSLDALMAISQWRRVERVLNLPQ